MIYVNLIVLFVSITIICYYAKCKSFFKAFFMGASSGIFALGTTVLLCPAMLSFNFFTVIMAVLAGAPGIGLEILIKQFLI